MTSHVPLQQSFDARLQVLLPPQYRESYQDLQPTPMGAAGLVYDASGHVAWDQIWGSFCHLAMAGGPPHKGLLLEPGPRTERALSRQAYDAAAHEICRGISMVTGLRASATEASGWIDLTCQGDGMAGWLLRAITMENVAVRRRGSVVQLPVAARFRLEKEVKNVVTVVAKTCHYWMTHMPHPQQRAIGELLQTLDREMPLVVPDYDDASSADDAESLASRVTEATGLPCAVMPSAGWVGITCPTVGAAVWMMRALVVSNVLARREGLAVCVPVPPTDTAIPRLVTAIDGVHRFAPAHTRVGSAR